MKLSFALALTNLLSCVTTVAVINKLWKHASGSSSAAPPTAPGHRRYLQQGGGDQSLFNSSSCSMACCTNSTPPPGFSWGPTSCTLLRAAVAYDDGRKEEVVACELPNKQIVEVTWLPDTLTAVFESGASLLVASDIIVDGNELYIPAGSTYEVRSL